MPPTPVTSAAARSSTESTTLPCLRTIARMTTARIEPLDRTISANGVNLHYVDWGGADKPPLVVLHGFSSQARYWDGFAVRMRDAYRVYCLDQRGHGDSDWSEDYGPDAMPDDLLAFADALGLETFTLLGHSM